MKIKLFILFFIPLIIFTFAGCEKSPTSQTSPLQEPETGYLPETETLSVSLENKLVALGSSLTRASNLSSEKQGENENYSFSVGTKIDSLYLHLKKSGDLKAVNLAFPGAEMRDVLERQLPKALKENPKFISLDPGADIVGHESSISDYKQCLSQIIKEINPETTVFLFTYPNFIKMRSANYASCRENKIGVNLENLSEARVQEFNQAIKEAVARKNNIILVDLYDLLGPEDISDYDCLHINISGQEKIARQFIISLNK